MRPIASSSRRSSLDRGHFADDERLGKRDLHGLEDADHVAAERGVAGAEHAQERIDGGWVHGRDGGRDFLPLLRIALAGEGFERGHDAFLTGHGEIHAGRVANRGVGRFEICDQLREPLGVAVALGGGGEAGIGEFLRRMGASSGVRASSRKRWVPKSRTRAARWSSLRFWSTSSLRIGAASSGRLSFTSDRTALR